MSLRHFYGKWELWKGVKNNWNRKLIGFRYFRKEWSGSTHLHHAYTGNPVWILKYAEIFLIVMDSENNWIIVHWLLPPIEIEVRGFMNHNRRSVNNNTSNGQIFFLLFCRPPQNVKSIIEFQLYDIIFLAFLGIVFLSCTMVLLQPLQNSLTVFIVYQSPKKITSHTTTTVSTGNDVLSRSIPFYWVNPSH